MAGRNTYLWNNLTLSPAQMASALWQAGFRDPNVIAQMVSIGQRESSGRAGVHGSTASQGKVSGDRGLFQINYVHDARLKAAGIIRTAADLFDPVTNAKAAYYLSGGGNPQTMRQLWGGGAGGWVGSSGSLPRPNYTAVQQAQASGWAANWGPSGSGGGSGGGLPTPPPGLGTEFYDMLYQGYNNALGLNQAQTQNQVDYQRQQQKFAEQLAGYQQTGLDLQRQQLDLENRYQNDLALLNRNLTAKQQESNLKHWRQIAANVDSNLDLEKAILGEARRYVGQQKGFNQRDYDLAVQAIRNVVTTERDRWAQVQQVRGVETGLARQKEAFISKGAREAYGQALKESAFVEGEQRRKAASDATARGATSSVGFGQDLAAFAGQHGLTNAAAKVTRDDVMRMARHQMAGELADIDQAFQQGRITYQDALRRATDARLRSHLTAQQNAASLNHQGQQAYHQWQGNTLDLQNQRARAYIDFHENYNNLKAQQEQAARTQAYNNALYGINVAGVQNTSASYAAQLAQQQAASQYGIDQSWINGAMGVNQINQDRIGTFQDQVGGLGTSWGAGAGWNAPATRPTTGSTYQPPQPQRRDRLTPTPA